MASGSADGRKAAAVLRAKGLALSYAKESLGYDEASAVEAYVLRSGAIVVLVDTKKDLKYGAIVMDDKVQEDSVPEYEYWQRKGRL